MFEVYWGDVELTALTLVVSLVIVLPLQLLLCFKAKRRAVRFLPLLILSVLAAAFLLLTVSTPGWDGLGYLFLAIYAAFLMLMCGVGWGIWALRNTGTRKRPRSR